MVDDRAEGHAPRLTRLLRCLIMGAITVITSCREPPELLPDHEEAEIYAEVLRTARDELGTDTHVAVHPYLAVARDTQGVLLARLDQFEYDRSAPLQMLQRSDTTLVLCDFNDQGVCKASSYLVLSQIRRVAGRDAELLVFAVDETSTRYLGVRLRYHGGAWHVAAARLLR